MHPQRDTFWCGFWAGSIIGPYFFENEAGQVATVNGARYRDMITQFFLPKLDDIGVANMWFQQDNAICHTANKTIQLLHETFPGRVFSHFGDQNWLPRSCDLTSLDFFLWVLLIISQRSMLTIPQPHVHYKRKLNAASTKFSHNYAEKCHEKFRRKGAYVPAKS